MKYFIICVLIVFETIDPCVFAMKWLSYASLNQLSSAPTKDQCALAGLVKRQQIICRRNLEVMSSVMQGARLAIHECQYQFQHRRWNCSAEGDGQSMLLNVLNQGTRESSFVHAISAAGVSYAVTQACSTGELESCGCDRSIRGQSPEGFKWAGCSHNIAFGSAFSRNFMDAKERARGADSSRALMNLHNNQAGRLLLENSIHVQCKCHGVSGSCELKTCWRSLPSFRKIGDVIKVKFDGASEVRQKSTGSRKMLIPTNSKYKRQKQEDLVYLVASPDFCNHNRKAGSPGTVDRLCSSTSKAMDGCELMCCGRGYRTIRRIVEERCHCKFKWCCEVQCQTCRKEVEEHRCL